MNIEIILYFYSQVTDDNEQPLSAVLLSLSAAQFRSNNFTSESGSMVFANLVTTLFLIVKTFSGSSNNTG